MVVDFSSVDVTKRPTLILRNLDDTAIGVLNNAFDVEVEFCYNEVSELSFKYPAYTNGVELPEYDKLTGMRIVDMQGYGQFLLRNPDEEDNGVSRIKDCKAYSLEYELTNKTIYVESGTFNFWNPTTPDSTILGIICDEAISWSVGEVSSDLIGKYRTFEVVDQNIYDWIKNDLQDTYACIFDFDTYNRTINVRSVNDTVQVNPIYLDTSNLIKEIEIEEDTDDLVNCLEVYGADDINIRDVNPMGTNKIYNLDAYMTEEYFTADMIAKWEEWKTAFDNYQTTYYNFSIARYMKLTEQTVAETEYSELSGEKTALYSAYYVTYEAYEQGLTGITEDDVEEAYAALLAKIEEMEEKQAEIDTITEEYDALTESMKEIIAACSFDNFFTDEEQQVIDRYLVCGTLTDTTFVATTTNAYSDAETVMDVAASFYITDLTSITKAVYTDDITFYIVHGGTISVDDTVVCTAEIVNGTVQINSDDTFICTLYLNAGSSDEEEFDSGNIAMTGTLSSYSIGDDSITLVTSTASFYLTQDVSVYQQLSIEQELYEYAVEFLERQSEPTYYFSVKPVNFLALEDFVKFAQSFELGEKVYINTSMGVLSPIAIGASINFDDLSDFSLEFGNAYTLNDSSFKLEDILDQSVSMGRTLDYNQYNYSNFVSSGASTAVSTFMSSALEAMKNTILAGTNNSIVIDGSGIHCYSVNSTTGAYDDEQMWINNNSLMFTEDSWASATMGIGKFSDTNLGTIYGIVAPAIVGTLLAGSNLVIESEKQDGSVAVFKMDADGVTLHNALFNLYQADSETNKGFISLSADYGILGGSDYETMFSYDSNGLEEGVITNDGEVITTLSELYDGDYPADVNFWLDTNGDVYLKGTIEATSGVFSGSIEIGGNTGFRVDSNGNTSIGGTASNAALYIASNGYLRVGGNTASPNFSIYPNGSLFVNGNASEATLSLYSNGDLVTNGDITAYGDITATGSLTATSADISGRINALSLYINGSNILTNTTSSSSSGTTVYYATSSSQISSDYLSLYGLTVYNTSTNGTTFAVSSTGAVTINGKVTMRSGSTINWSNVSESNIESSDVYTNVYTVASNANDTASAVESALSELVNGNYTGGSYLSGTYIYSPTLIASSIGILTSTSASIGAVLTMNTSSTNAFQIQSYKSLRLLSYSSNSYNTYIAGGNGAGYIQVLGNTKTTSVYAANAVVVSSGTFTVSSEGTAWFAGDLSVDGDKNRLIKTNTYSTRALYSLETPTPSFEDLGESVTDDDGICYIVIDDIFAETVDYKSSYQVFVQKYGDGDIYVSERQPTYFVVRGTANLPFGWRVIYPQIGGTYKRLEDKEVSSVSDVEEVDYEDEAATEVDSVYTSYTEYDGG